MSNTNKSMKNDSFYLFLVLTFIAGFLSGAGFAVYKMSPADSPPSSAAVQQGTQPNTVSNQESQAITNLEAQVTTNPNNAEAWTQLGNLYFDTNKHEQAITAYTKSIELSGGNANVLTDLGVMYRKTKQPQKAIESFEKATAMDPTHEISRLNKGIVLMFDLNDTTGAIAAWEGLLKINPNAKTANGESVKAFVDKLKQDAANKGQ